MLVELAAGSLPLPLAWLVAPANPLQSGPISMPFSAIPATHPEDGGSMDL